MIHRDEAKVRDRAYELWEMAGSPDGRDWEFWHQAEQELSENGDEDMSEQAATIRQPPPVSGGVPH